MGRSFRTTVEGEPGQTVLPAGPYRWVRHPSYTGLLLIAAGFGVVRGAWVSLGVCVVLLLPALVRRIRVEEADLDHVLGGAYRTYESTTTARLILVRRLRQMTGCRSAATRGRQISPRQRG